MPTAALLSFRLGGTDGVAVESAKWQAAFADLGYDTYRVAGEGTADHLLPGLAMDAPEPPTATEVTDALARADVVVVENLCSLPLNPAAAAVVAQVLAGRPAVLHHHDLPWQRPQFADHGPPPDDDRWAHVTINELSRKELADRGITATTVYNAFETDGRAPFKVAAERDLVRESLGLGEHDRLVLQPTRALPRKNVPGGLAVADALGATYWLLGEAEDGYGPELERVLAGARGRVVQGWPGAVPSAGVLAAYAASDVVTLPSTWEGFGNPSVESAVHRRPLAIGPYPVAAELAAFGFQWFGLDQVDELGRWLDAPDDELLATNAWVAATHFSRRDLPGRLEPVLPHH